MWQLTQSEVVKYDGIFVQLNPIGGKLDGEKVKQVMTQSQLSVETLGKVWDLADMDGDGYLDRNEFLLAMHLVYRCTEGDMLPSGLPGYILFAKDQYFAKYPPRFMVAGSISADTFPSSKAMVPVNFVSSPGIIDEQKQTLALTPQMPSATPGTVGPSLASPLPPALAPPVYPPWAISAEEFAKASALFASIDVDADGLVSGLETREVLLRSHLQQNVLAHIWDLVDMHGVGMLNREQFAVILHLVSEQLNPSHYPASGGLPDRLPLALVPPSLRPIPPDPAIFAESNRLIGQIEAIRKECCELEASNAQLKSVFKQRAAEAVEQTRLAEAHERAAQSLTEQNEEAGRRLGEFAAQRDALRNQLEDLKQKVDAERLYVDQLRGQVDAQQAVVRDQECELTKLRSELNELIREETQLKDRVTSGQHRLEVIEAETRETQRRVEQTNQRVAALESTRGQLMEVIEQYRAMLNGDPSAVQPNEMHVKLLLASDPIGSSHGGAGVGGNSLTGSFASFDTGLGGGAGSGFGWPPSPTPSTTVPLAPGVTPAASAFEPVDSGSQFSWPGADSHRSADGGAVGVGKVSSSVFDSDPFGPPSQSFAPDPFKDDPFASHSFGFPNSVANSTNVSAFDSFVAPVSRAPPTSDNWVKSTLNDTDFDAVFGPPEDLFSSDPFSAVEQCAQPQQHQPTSTNSSTVDVPAWSTIPKRFPPPRPKAQPGAGKPVSGRKSTGDQPEHYYLAKRDDSANSAPAVRTSPRAAKKASSRSFHLLPRGRSKKDELAGSQTWRGPPSVSSSMAAMGLMGSLRGLTEEQQLSLATMESAQLAREEARARQHEEEDLQRAIQLSKLESMYL